MECAMKTEDKASEGRKSRKRSPKAAKPAAASGKKAAASAKKAGKSPFYIVGIGGSAGALKAFEQFFGNMPPDSGMAFVLVPHLDPTHKGFMPELIQRYTGMKVLQVEDGMEVRPNRVYVIPPNRDMSILHGTLQLLEPSAPHGLRLPIDSFFRHLALDQKEMAVCIILSGMGSDGTLGLKAVKEQLGMTMVQEPGSAEYDPMPQSAIGTGLVDFIAPAGELPAELLEYARRPFTVPVAEAGLAEAAELSIQKILVLLRAHTGNDFSLYKRNTIYRRVERRMSVHQISTIVHYLRYLQNNPHEIDLLFKELLIGVTNFFREPEAFAAFQKKVIPELVLERDMGDVLRVWVPACSTGEEAYSLAIIFKEGLERAQKQGVRIQFFASDIDKDAIANARQGRYPANLAADVSPERLQRFFVKDGDNYRIKKEIRDMVIFAAHNVIADPPYAKLDVLCCRNLLIYMTAELQRRLLPLFHYCINPGGFLFLGSSETIGDSDLFLAFDSKWKIFKRAESPSSPMAVAELRSALGTGALARGPMAERPHKGREIAISDLTHKALLERYAPPAVLINGNGDILYIYGRTGKYLEPATGKANMNIFAMAREGLRVELPVAIRKAAQEKITVAVEGVRVQTNGEGQLINLTVKPVGEEGDPRNLLLVVFEDVAALPEEPPPAKKKRKAPSKEAALIAALQEELRHSKEKLRDTVEEMETSQEELKSMNEELQSSNEELQSTNEEMITSREELQSLNEELMAVNAELQGKLDELSRSRSDMKNLLDATEIATVFLDQDLNIKRFTPQIRKIINLIDSDVGRPVAHLATNLKYEDLAGDAAEVLRTLVFKETNVQSEDGCWYSMRIMPYRTLDNVIDGAVLTFSDVTALKEIEHALRESEQSAQEARRYAESIVETVREPLVILDGDLRIVSANRSFYREFQVSPEEAEKRLLYEMGESQWDIPALRRMLEEVISKDTELYDFVVEDEFPKIGHRVMLLNARQLRQEAGGRKLLVLAMEDVTEKRK
jgi:two-component system CheB/CheR fusion protein